MEWTGQVPAWSVLGLSAVAAIGYGARRYRPKAPMLCQKTARVLDQIAKLGVRTLNSSGYPVIELPLGRADDIDAVGKLLIRSGAFT